VLVFMGGARDTSVAVDPAAWTPVPNYVEIVAPVTANAMLRADVRARNPGVSVTARLFCVADNAAVVTGAPVMATAPTRVALQGVIEAGKVYRFELLSSANGEGVYGIGTLETI